MDVALTVLCPDEEAPASVSTATLATVCEIVAGAALGGEEVESTMGEIALMPHQRSAVRVLHQALARFGGALLADDVGLGKTFTALAVARRYVRPLVVAPASLREMWRGSIARASSAATVLSYEQLSAGLDAHEQRHDLLVLDEAHHARTPSTRRYSAISRLAWGAHVLLVSATPVHNRRDDLHALFALFLGSGGRDVGADVLSQLVCRQRAADAGAGIALPRLRELEWNTVAESPQILAAIEGLPPPLPPSDGGCAHALSTLTLIRAWCSSDAALLGAIRRRLQTAAALEHALSHGRHPTRTELTSWAAANGAVQLAFPELATASDGVPDAASLLASLRAHAAALRQLRETLLPTFGRDEERFGALRRLVEQHRGDRVLVFTHSADTARAAYGSLLGRVPVACLTGNGAVIASGRIPRSDALRAFAPSGRAPTPPGATLSPSLSLWPAIPGRFGDESHEVPKAANDSWFAGGGSAPSAVPVTLARAPRALQRSSPTAIGVLVATDVLSEGVDLQLARVVVHLDLPWTMARLEQRVGRARRIGAEHGEVAHYAIAPPVQAVELERVVHHLATKARISRDLVGSSESFAREFDSRHGRAAATPPASSLLPSARLPSVPATAVPLGSSPDAMAALRGCLRLWLADVPCSERIGRCRDAAPECVVAACRSHGTHGIIAALRDSEGLSLVAGAPGAPSADPHVVLQLAKHADVRAARPVGDAEVRDILSSLRRWCAARDVARDALSALAMRSPTHRAFARRLASSLAAAPRHLRAGRAVATSAARDLLRRSRGTGAETVLRDLLAAAPSRAEGGVGESEWLTRVISTLEPRASPSTAVGIPGVTTLAAVLVLVSDDARI